jgi:hypothetical protein
VATATKETNIPPKSMLTVRSNYYSLYPEADPHPIHGALPENQVTTLPAAIKVNLVTISNAELSS